MISNNLNSSEYHSYYKSYIDKSTSVDIVEGLLANLESVLTFLLEIPEEKYDYAYADDKWTVKDVLLHVIDTERIFCYRALRIVRGDKTPLAGFEQDDYVVTANALNRTFSSLVEEYKSVRQATITLFKNLENESLLQIGEASGSPVSVRALGYIITGHENHHIQVLKERYL
jgi:uncharacterized damage-inducible protein DinB